MVKGSIVNNNGKNEYTAYTSCYSTRTNTYYCNYENDFELKKYNLKELANNATDLVIG